MDHHEVKIAVITAAGWGTRFLPATKTVPKEMLPLLDKPLIQYSVEEAVACGAELIVIVSSRDKKPIEDYFDTHFELEHFLSRTGQTALLDKMVGPFKAVDICYVRQQERKGLGHAVLTARRVIGNQPFMLFLPDDIFEQGAKVLKRMLGIYEEHHGSVLAVKRVGIDQVSRYGVVEAELTGDRVYKVKGMVEKPEMKDAPSDLAIMGRYVLSPDILDILENTPPGRNGEIQLTDALQKLAVSKTIYAYEFEGKRYDTGTLAGWLETTIELALSDPELGPGLTQHVKKLLENK